MRRRDAPGRAGFLLFWGLGVLPVAGGLLYGLLYSIGLTGLLARGFTLDPWRRVLTSRETWTSLLLSASVAGAVTALSAGLGLILALLLRERLDRGPAARALLLPILVPPAVAAFLALQVLSGTGLLARLLLAIGIVTSLPGPSFVQDPFAVGVVLAHTGIAAPFLALLFRRLHAAESLDALEEIALTLGASRRQAVVRVAAPVLLRAAAGPLLLLFVFVLGSFEIPWLLGRQAPQMLSVLAMRKFALYDIAEKPEAHALAWIYTAVLAALLAMALRRLHEKPTS